MNAAHHDHEADALPQADRPFRNDASPGAFRNEAGTFYNPSMGKSLVHTDKRGPAFTTQAEVIRAIGDLCYAWSRSNGGPIFADVMPAWDRALTALGYAFTPLALSPLVMSQSSDVLASIIQAMCYTGTPLAETKWRHADAALRGLVLCAAEAKDRWAATVAKQAHDDEREQDGDVLAEIGLYQRQAAELRTWAGAL